MSSQKKNPTADGLIDSLLDDVKDLYEHSGPFTQSDFAIDNSVLNIDLQDSNSNPPQLQKVELVKNPEPPLKSSVVQPAPIDIKKNEIPKNKTINIEKLDSDDFKTVSLQNPDNFVNLQKPDKKDFSAIEIKNKPTKTESIKPNLQSLSNEFELDKTIALGSEVKSSAVMADFSALELNPPTLPKMQKSGMSSTEEPTEFSNQTFGKNQSSLGTQNNQGTQNTLSDKDRTLAVEGFAKSISTRVNPIKPRDSIGKFGEAGVFRSGNAYVNPDASLIQSENLRLAQQRIAELEKENDLLRQENEELFSAGDIIRSKTDELNAKVFHLEQEKNELEESFHKEVLILRGSLQFKETELSKSKNKIQELEARLKSDFKKIRVRERELENRLELSKAEKAALVRAKDENILELKRKIDHLESELDNYKSRCLDLNRNVETQQEQFKKTVKALRLALTNLESKEAGTYKKAE